MDRCYFCRGKVEARGPGHVHQWWSEECSSQNCRLKCVPNAVRRTSGLMLAKMDEDNRRRVVAPFRATFSGPRYMISLVSQPCLLRNQSLSLTR